jgi:cytochrome oxidase Cu insertion factor (SCO1/SenC/PrrC family)
MSSSKVQKLVRKTRQSKERNDEFYIISITLDAEQPTEFHTKETLIGEQRNNFRTWLYDDFPELRQPVDSPHVSREWDHPIERAGPMKRRRASFFYMVVSP